MANNIKIGLNSIVAKSTVTFTTAGINTSNTEIIFKVDQGLSSFVPGRAINGISGFEANKGYYMVAKTAFDLEAYVVPPISSIPQLAQPASFAAAPSGSTQINLSWAAVTNATGYVVDRATNAGFTTGVALAIYSAGGTSYNDTGLTASTTYYYRIRATAAGYTDSLYSTDDAVTGGASYNISTTALIDALDTAGVTLSTTEKDAYDAFIVSMKSGTLWGKTQNFYFLGGSFNKSKFNFKDPSNDVLTSAGTITYAANGANGDGSAGSYLNTTAFLPAQNSAAMFASQKGTGSGVKSIIGNDNAGGGAYLIPGNPLYCIFNGSVSPSSVANATIAGRYCVSRTSSAGFKVYRNGSVILDASSDTSATPLSISVKLLTGASSYPSDQIVSCAGIFDGLSGAEAAELDGYVATLETALSR
jgi:hypothetical protein